MKRKFIIGFIFFLFCIVVYFNINNKYKAEETYIRGISMSPTLFDGEKVKLVTNYYKYNDIKRGDIIGFNLKNSGNYVKRIVAIPKDKIIFGKDGYLYINNIKQKEDYIISKQKFSINRLSLLLKQLENYDNIIPENMYLVLGDNRLKSKDSTWFGLIHKDQIIGLVK